jgi:hypothetical protein
VQLPSGNTAVIIGLSSIASIYEYGLADSVGRGRISRRRRSSSLEVLGLVLEEAKALAEEGLDLEEAGSRAGGRLTGRRRSARWSGVRLRISRETAEGGRLAGRWRRAAHQLPSGSRGHAHRRGRRREFPTCP